MLINNNKFQIQHHKLNLKLILNKLIHNNKKMFNNKLILNNKPSITNNNMSNNNKLLFRMKILKSIKLQTNPPNRINHRQLMKHSYKILKKSNKPNNKHQIQPNRDLNQTNP